MRRRVAFAVIASVVTALVLVGLGTLVLSRGAARRSTEADLRRQASMVAELVASLGTANKPSPGGDARLSPAALRKMSKALEVEDLGAVIVGPRGPEYGGLPAGIELSAQEARAVHAGTAVSGVTRGGHIYAVASRNVGDSSVLVGVTGSARGLFAGSAGWFLLSSLFVIVGSVALALWIGSRLARPVLQATEVTRRIAGGDLAARLPEPPNGVTDETAVLARSVNAMADALERSRGMEQQFLMSVSHDLRTPLTNIRGYAEAIADEATAPAAGAEVILRESARLERLVRDLLDLARLDARQFTLHMIRTDLTPIVIDAAESHRAELIGSGLTLDVHRAGQLLCRVDPDRLAQVVGNLVGNATRFAATAVTVECQDDQTGWAVVQVRNDGVAITAVDLPFVFDRLYQGHDQPPRSESHSGLGLAIVRELVGAMGGDVGVVTPPEGGTVFWFRIPLT